MLCPNIRDEEVFFVGGPDQVVWSKVMDFSRLLESTQKGPLCYRIEDNLPYGTKWNVASTFGEGRSFGAWACELPEVRFACTLEFPYSKSKVEVSPESARMFGRDVAHAIVEFLTKEKN